MKAKPQEVKEITNEDAAKKVHQAVIKFCEDHEVYLDECEVGDPMPICYDFITGLSPESAVLFWVLSGAPNSDGTSMLGKFKNAELKAKKRKQDEQDEDVEEEDADDQEGSEEEEESSDGEEADVGAKAPVQARGSEEAEPEPKFPKHKDRDRGKGEGTGSKKKKKYPKESEETKRKKREERFGTGTEKPVGLNPEHAKAFEGVKGDAPLISKRDSKGKGDSGSKRKGVTGAGLAPAVLEGQEGPILAGKKTKKKKKKKSEAERTKDPEDAEEEEEPEDAADEDPGVGAAPVRRVVAPGTASQGTPAEQSIPDRSVGLAGYLSRLQKTFTRVLVRGRKLLGAATSRGMKADLGVVGAFPQRASIRLMLQEYFAKSEAAFEFTESHGTLSTIKNWFEQAESVFRRSKDDGERERTDSAFSTAYAIVGQERDKVLNRRNSAMPRRKRCIFTCADVAGSQTPHPGSFVEHRYHFRPCPSLTMTKEWWSSDSLSQVCLKKWVLARTFAKSMLIWTVRTVVRITGPLATTKSAWQAWFFVKMPYFHDFFGFGRCNL